MIKIELNNNELIIYVWKYTNIRDGGSISYSDDKKNKLLSDINIGIDKSNGSFFLRQLEFLTRDNSDCYLDIELSSLPVNVPRHLDDPSDFVRHEKREYSSLEIHRTTGDSAIEFTEDSVAIKLWEKDLYKFFTRLYINFELYATEYDNKLSVNCKSRNTSELAPCDLVIWGVRNKEPIYY